MGKAIWRVTEKTQHRDFFGPARVQPGLTARPDWTGRGSCHVLGAPPVELHRILARPQMQMQETWLRGLTFEFNLACHDASLTQDCWAVPPWQELSCVGAQRRP